MGTIQSKFDFVFSLALVFCFLSKSQAQTVETNIDISEANPDQSITIDIPDGQIEILRLSVYDPDYPDEGQMFINGQGPISLFPGGNGGFDGQTINIDISLSEEQKNWFQPGDNQIQFLWVRSSGFIVESISIIGEVATRSYDAISINEDGDDPTVFELRALNIYKRLAGVPTPLDSPVIQRMAAAIQQDSSLEAAQMASAEPGFLNFVVRDMAARMSTREETVKTGLNDFIATFVGAVRDGLDARTLLTGDYFYMASPVAVVPNDLVDDLLKSNNHFQTLEEDQYDLGPVLTRVDGQQLRTPGDGTAPHPDPAGVLTSRTFMEAHASAGTNRRLVEYTMRAFACTPIEGWSDSTSPDIRVGRDVDRFPGGEGAQYQSTCKACHANMDGLRGAFARFNFADGFTKYADFYNSESGPDGMFQAPIGVSSKLNQNNDVFPSGFRAVDNSWENFARSPANQRLFGWRGTVARGAGVGQLGRIVSESQAFSRCMVQRVFEELCGRSPADFESIAIQTMAAEFENSTYNLKKLFETVAIRPECLGL